MNKLGFCCALSLTLIGVAAVAQERVVMPDRHKIEMSSQIEAMKSLLENAVRAMQEEVNDQNETISEQNEKIAELEEKLAGLGAGGGDVELPPTVADMMEELKGKTFSCNAKKFNDAYFGHDYKDYKVYVRVDGSKRIFTKACMGYPKETCEGYNESESSNVGRESRDLKISSVAQFTYEFDIQKNKYVAYLRGSFSHNRFHDTKDKWRRYKDSCEVQLN